MNRVGIIGCGRIAEQGHLPGYAELAGRISVVAVADPAAERRDLLGERLGVPQEARYAEYCDLLAHDDLDYVDICLPHHLHHAATIAAAEAGLNILLEKPIAANEDEALAMIAAVEKAGVVFSLIHNYSRQRCARPRAGTGARRRNRHALSGAIRRVRQLSLPGHGGL